jgi:hypothetical protein
MKGTRVCKSVWRKCESPDIASSDWFTRLSDIKLCNPSPGMRQRPNVDDWSPCGVWREKRPVELKKRKVWCELLKDSLLGVMTVQKWGDRMQTLQNRVLACCLRGSRNIQIDLRVEVELRRTKSGRRSSMKNMFKATNTRDHTTSLSA